MIAWIAPPLGRTLDEDWPSGDLEAGRFQDGRLAACSRRTPVVIGRARHARHLHQSPGLLDRREGVHPTPCLPDQPLGRPATIPLRTVEPTAAQADRVERRHPAAGLAGATGTTVAGPAEPHHGSDSCSAW